MSDSEGPNIFGYSNKENSEMMRIGLDNLDRLMHWVDTESEERLHELAQVSINLAFVIVNDMVSGQRTVDDLIKSLKTMFVFGYLIGSGADIPDVFKE